MERRQEVFFRKNLLIYPQFQLTLMGLNWAVITAVFAVLRIQSSRVFSDLTPLTSLSQISGDYSTYFLNFQADRLNTSLWFFYAIAMLASGALTLIVSYRFAGPLVRLKGYFQGLGVTQGPIRELNFRTGDFFSDLPPIVNSAIKRLKEADAKDVENSFKQVS
jgi:hypothetical protein